jgi:hypothetical protein
LHALDVVFEEPHAAVVVKGVMPVLAAGRSEDVLRSTVVGLGPDLEGAAALHRYGLYLVLLAAAGQGLPVTIPHVDGGVPVVKDAILIIIDNAGGAVL